MRMMKVFDAPYEPKEVWDNWVLYNDGDGNRGFIQVWVDSELTENGYEILYNWLTANGAEHGETVLIEYDW